MGAGIWVGNDGFRMELPSTEMERLGSRAGLEAKTGSWKLIIKCVKCERFTTYLSIDVR